MRCLALALLLASSVSGFRSALPARHRGPVAIRAEEEAAGEAEPAVAEPEPPAPAAAASPVYAPAIPGKPALEAAAAAQVRCSLPLLLLSLPPPFFLSYSLDSHIFHSPFGPLIEPCV